MDVLMFLLLYGAVALVLIKVVGFFYLAYTTSTDKFIEDVTRLNLPRRDFRGKLLNRLDNDGQGNDFSPHRGQRRHSQFHDRTPFHEQAEFQQKPR